MRDTGESAETIHHTTIKTDHLTVTAGKGIVAEVETKGELRQSLEALSSQPGMEWVSELRGRDDVNWTQVQAYYDHWDHKSQGLSAPAAALIAIAVTIATSGAGAGTGVALGVENTALAAGIDAAASAGIGSLATAATISMINNQGNIGAVLKELGSSESVRSILVSMASAAAFSGVGSLTDGHFAVDGRTLERGLTPSQYMQTVEYVQNIAGHAAVGCAAALASGQSCGSGAAAAALSGAAGPLYIGAGTVGGTVLASATGGLGAGLTGGDITQGMTTGAMGYLFNDMAGFASLLGGIDPSTAEQYAEGKVVIREIQEYMDKNFAVSYGANITLEVAIGDGYSISFGVYYNTEGDIGFQYSTGKSIGYAFDPSIQIGMQAGKVLATIGENSGVSLSTPYGGAGFSYDKAEYERTGNIWTNGFSISTPGKFGGSITETNSCVLSLRYGHRC